MYKYKTVMSVPCLSQVIEIRERKRNYARREESGPIRLKGPIDPRKYMLRYTLLYEAT